MANHRTTIITGADGFLGEEVCRELDRRDIPYRPWRKMRIQLTNQAMLLRATRGAKTIIHLAGNVRTPGTDNAEQHLTINALGTLNLLAAAARNHVRRFLLASTVEVYSPLLTQARIRENDLCAPESFYGQSKLLAETFVHSFAKTYPIQIAILRFAYLYGPRMHHTRLIPRLMKDARSGLSVPLTVERQSGTDMLHVRDAARAIALTLMAKGLDNAVMNISSGRATSVPDIVDAVRRRFPKLRVRIRWTEPVARTHVYDRGRAQRLIGFVPTVSLQTAIDEFINSEHA